MLSLKSGWGSLSLSLSLVICCLGEITNDFLESWVNYDALEDGGGKGGDLMASSPDHRYVLKQLNKGDHL